MKNEDERLARGAFQRKCLLSAVLLAIGSLALDVVAAPIESELAKHIERIVEPYVAAGDFSGVVAVQRDGHAPTLVAAGLASVELNVPHEDDGIFMIGSVAKQFTAAAILLLEQEGALKTTDSVSRYLVDCAIGRSVTIEQLVLHTSGVADIYSLEQFGQTAGHAGDFAEVVDDLCRLEPTHPPGSTFAYSNGGYALLAAIIERASGMSYGDYLARRIFKPLGLTSTAHDRPGPAQHRRVPGYDPWGTTALAPVVPVSPAYTIGSGSLWSSATDLLTWTSALHGGRLLSSASYQKMIHDHGRGYGYGVSVFKRFGRDVVSHDGRVAGYASDVARYLADRTTIVILSNVQSVARDEVRRSVAALVFGETPTVPEKRSFVDPPSDLDELLGVYAFGPAFEVTITASDERLLARANQGGFSELIAIGDGEWFSRMLYATVRFGRDESGAIDRLIWGRGEQAPVGRRVR